MAPTEAELLANYLIQPSTLTAITTLEQFKALFPRPLQSSPQVRSLFRDLQAQRADILDQVAENIADEAKRGLAMRREVLRAKREAEREDIDAEIEMERAVGASTMCGLGQYTDHGLLYSYLAMHQEQQVPSIPSVLLFPS
jgi:centromere-localized protein 2